MSEARRLGARSSGRSGRASILDRTARLAYAFLILNASAVAGMFAALLGRKVWR